MKKRNRNTARVKPSPNHRVQPLDLDLMPPQVAREMLTNPKGRLTNQFRKDCARARWSYEVSTRERKPVTAKFARRTHFANWEQLQRWSRRCIERSLNLRKVIAGLEKLLVNAQTDYEKSEIQRGIAAVSLRRLVLAQALDAVIAEQRRRCPQFTFAYTLP